VSIAFVYTNLAPSVGLAGPDDDVIFAAATGSELAPLLRAAGQRVTLIDDDPAVLAGHEGVLSSAAVLATPHVQAALAAAGCTAVVPFKTSPRFERLAEMLNLRVLASPARLVRQLENKLELPRIAAAAGVIVPDTRVVTFNDELVAEARAGRIALPAILQSATGFAGNGTELVRDPGELAAAVARAARGSVGKLAQVIAGSPVTVNGCVVGDGPGDVLVGGVTHQLTGIAECTDAPYGSCGNDWSMPLEQALLQRVREVGAAVGRTIADDGFRGVYGVDAVITDDGDVFLIELNSRHHCQPVPADRTTAPDWRANPVRRPSGRLR